MAREALRAKQQRAVEVLRRLDAAMPGARIELNYQSPFELLVAVILSAQCTDKRVNQVTPALFQRFPHAEALAQASEEDVRALIQTCGLYRTKAKNLIATARALVANHGGRVPSAREALSRLPGVGNKTAGVVSIHTGGDAAFPVDTHVQRLARRLNFSSRRTPDEVERELQSLLPSEHWAHGHQLLVWHGRRTCFARAPACGQCPVADLCPQRDVKGKRAARSSPS